MLRTRCARTFAALIVTSACAACESVVSDAGCSTYQSHRGGLIGADAPATPDGVIDRVLVMDAAMEAACRR